VNTELADEVRTLLANQCGVSEDRISSSTRLLDDLGIDGDDAAELLEAFAAKFDVDLSGFDFQSFFHSEAALGCISGLWLWLIGDLGGPKLPLTVGDLVHAADKKELKPDKGTS
jgi:acyl carrier protein